jgi:hypothetical protein
MHVERRDPRIRILNMDVTSILIEMSCANRASSKTSQLISYYKITLLVRRNSIGNDYSGRHHFSESDNT